MVLRVASVVFVDSELTTDAFGEIPSIDRKPRQSTGNPINPLKAALTSTVSCV